MIIKDLCSGSLKSGFDLADPELPEEGVIDSLGFLKEWSIFFVDFFLFEGAEFNSVD